jgi:hypothetical protein
MARASSGCSLYDYLLIIKQQRLTRFRARQIEDRAIVFGGLVGGRKRVRDVEFLGESGKPRIRGPEAISTDDSRGQQMDIKPSGPLTMQTALPYEGDDISMRNRGCLVHLRVSIEQLSTTAFVTDK